MKVRNVSNSVVYVADKTIEPGKTAELSKEEMAMSGVKALIESGELEIVEEKTEEKKREKKAQKKKSEP
ncbi:DUF7444 family protein [Geoglobus acetivorans]|uniref:Uncharacterized protein n=1 Tax=Geoglobus acetivorans TaxID=565033 RepID=A0ABZ3H500_GEOAI|nr:hypothetical protein [Geoglobus acetivorans]